jgi:hypothetical protein
VGAQYGHGLNKADISATVFGPQSPVGAQYGHGLNRLNGAVLSILTRLYANQPPAQLTLTPQQEHNIRRHEHNTQRDELVRQARESGATYPEIARTFGISLGRAHQIVNRKP